MERRHVIVARSEGYIDRPVHQDQAGALPLIEAVEGHVPTAVGARTRPAYGSLDKDRAPELFCSTRDIQCVEAINAVPAFLGVRDDVQGAGGRVDDWCGRDANLRLDGVAVNE